MGSRYKLVLVGEFGVGKTSLLLRFCNNTWSEQSEATLGTELGTKKVHLSDNETREMVVWDTVGLVCFRNRKSKSNS
jgi:GTPase SAR1 family protein